MRLTRRGALPVRAPPTRHVHDDAGPAGVPGRQGGSMIASATTAGDPQHLRALQRANEVRLARAELKRCVADGELTAADVVLESPWQAESMTLADLLMSQRRWAGPAAAGS